MIKLLIILPFIIKGQDSLFFRNGSKDYGKVIEIRQDTVTYQNSGEDQSFIKVPSTVIKLIRYRNQRIDSSFKKNSSLIHQTKSSNLYENDIYLKNQCVLSFNSSCGGLYDERNNNLYLSLFFNPKVGFFIADKLNIVIGYLGIRNSSSVFPEQNGYYNNLEITSNYFFFIRKRNSLHAQLGLIYGQLPDPLYIRKLGLSPKIGGGTSWRFKKHGNFTLSLNAFILIPLIKTPPGQKPFIATWDIGINYFLKGKSNTKTQ